MFPISRGVSPSARYLDDTDIQGLALSGPSVQSQGFGKSTPIRTSKTDGIQYCLPAIYLLVVRQIEQLEREHRLGAAHESELQENLQNLQRELGTYA